MATMISYGKVTSPKMGDQVMPGKDVMVVWEYASGGTVDQPETVDIELRDVATGAPVRTIASKVPNRGYYFWNVDSRTPLGKNRFLFVGSLLRPGAPSVQSAPFDVVPHPATTAAISAAVSAVKTTAAAAAPSGRKQTRAGAAARQQQVKAKVCTAQLSCSSVSADNNINNDEADIDKAAAAINDMSLDETTPSGCGGDSMPPPAARRGAVGQRAAKRRRDALATSSSSSAGAAGGANKTARQQRLLQSTTTFPWAEYPEFVYFTANMDTVTVRQSLRAVVKDDDITADTVLESGETAGMFCVRYLLMHYYRKQVDRDNPTVAQAIMQNAFVPDPALVGRYNDLLASKSLSIARRIPARTTRSSSLASAASTVVSTTRHPTDKPTAVSASANTRAAAGGGHIVVPPSVRAQQAPMRLSVPQRRAN